MSENSKTAVSVDDLLLVIQSLGDAQEEQGKRLEALQARPIALDALKEAQDEQQKVLHTLEARPIVDVTGIERRLEEVADAVERLKAPERERRARAWWVTPLFVTLAYVLGVLSTYGVLWIVQRQRLAQVKQPGIAAPVTPPVGKKGK